MQEKLKRAIAVTRLQNRCESQRRAFGVYSHVYTCVRAEKGKRRRRKMCVQDSIRRAHFTAKFQRKSKEFNIAFYNAFVPKFLQELRNLRIFFTPPLPPRLSSSSLLFFFSLPFPRQNVTYIGDIIIGIPICPFS